LDGGQGGGEKEERKEKLRLKAERGSGVKRKESAGGAGSR